MFERFTDRSRRVLVLAQEEARLLGHRFIGTEHLLLGLLHDGEGPAAEVLDAAGVGLEAARAAVVGILGSQATRWTGSPPFTPRAKKVFELSLREALSFGDHDIGTDHLLLGLVRIADGVASQVLVQLGADPGELRVALYARREAQDSEPGLAPSPGRAAVPVSPFPPAPGPLTPAASRARRLSFLRMASSLLGTDPLVHTDHPPGTDYARYLVAIALDGTLEPGSTGGADVVAGKRRLRVAALVTGPAAPTGWRLPWLQATFDELVVVVLERFDYTVRRGAALPADVVVAELGADAGALVVTDELLARGSDLTGVLRAVE